LQVLGPFSSIVVMREHLPKAVEGDKDSQPEPLVQLKSSKQKPRLPVREERKRAIKSLSPRN
jgi:hypothetical protein